MENSDGARTQQEMAETNLDEEKTQEVEWPDDPNNPKNFVAWRKWVMVLIVSFSSLCMYDIYL